MDLTGTNRGPNRLVEVAVQIRLKLRHCIKVTLKKTQITCKSDVSPPRKTQGSCSPLIKDSFQPFENPKMGSVKNQIRVQKIIERFHQNFKISSVRRH